MKFLTQWPPAHHAYALSSMYTNVEEVKNEIAHHEVSYFFARSYDVFGINDARMIKELQSEKTDTASVFILSFSVINTEAQNALLKVLEEPTENTYFFLLYPNFKQLLPTLQSRLEAIEISKEERREVVTETISAKEYIEMTLDQRFAFNKTSTDAKAGDDRFTKEQVKQLLYSLERTYAESKRTSNTEVLETIYDAPRCINANGASIKMILDMVAVHVEPESLATKS